MGSKLHCFMGNRDLISIFSRNEIYNVNETKWDLMTNLINALPEITNAMFGCEIKNIIYLQSFNSSNPNIFDLSQLMAPVGYGLCLRFGKRLERNNATYRGTVLEQIMLKNDDVLRLEDNIASELMDSIYSENSAVLDGYCGQSLSNELNLDLFNQTFETYSEERGGKSKYIVEPYLSYGHIHDENGEVILFENENLDYEIPDYFSSEDRLTALFDIIKTARQIHKSIYSPNHGNPIINANSHISLITLKHEEEHYLIIESFTENRHSPQHLDRVGCLFKLTPNTEGDNIEKIIYNAISQFERKLNSVYPSQETQSSSSFEQGLKIVRERNNNSGRNQNTITSNRARMRREQRRRSSR